MSESQTNGLLILETPPLLTTWRPWPLRIITLGEFRIEKDGVPLVFSGKVQKKPLELLRLLIALGGRNVSEQRLNDLLWPDNDGTPAHRSFATTLFRLRRLLGCEQTLHFHEGRLSLDPHSVWLDVWAFERAIGLARVAWESCEFDQEQAMALTDQALALYGGDFLPDERDKAWTFDLRERLRSKFTLKKGTLCEFWENSGELRKAIYCYHDALEVDSLAEELYQRLMLCHHRAGQKAEAVQVYHRCRRHLDLTLSVTPSVRTEEIYRMVSAATKDPRT